MSIKQKILETLKENNVNPNIIRKVPTVKLTVGVETTSAKFKKLYEQLTRARYKPELKEDGKSMWIGNVCIAENVSGKAWIYPANFLKFTEENLEEGKTSEKIDEAKLTNDEFNKDAKLYKTADKETRIELEKKWGPRSAYFVSTKHI